MFRRRGTLLILLGLSGLLGSWWLCCRNEPKTASASRETPEASRSTTSPAFTSATAPTLDGPATSPEPRHAFQFPGSRMLEERTLGPDATGLITKLQLLQTRGQYPLVRVIETHREGNADSTERAAMVADHVTVKLSAGRQPNELIAWAEAHGLKLRRTVGADDLYLLQLAQPDLAGFDALLQRLNVDPARPIDYAEPDYLRFAASVPNDTRFAEQWALHNTGQTGGTPDADVDAPEAWDISRGSSAVVVAVIDSGMDLTHPDLAANLWRNSGELPGDNIDNDGNGYIDDVNGWNYIDPWRTRIPADTEGHGTHCAGVLGGVGGNNSGISGICPVVRIMPLKAIASDGSIAVSSEASALRYAIAKGAKICSLSFGGPGPASTTEKNAVLAAYNAGVLLVCAAGNEATNLDSRASYPASFSYNNVISVAASGHADARIAFSNYGPVGVDLAAPGVGILSTLPGGTYGYESGTSMSTPLVAGACALLSASQPSLNYAAIKSAILSACDPVAAWKGKTRTGGRLNVARALKIGNGPFIELTSVKSSDGKTYGANGNNDGVINAGEDIALTLTVRNGGPVIATGVSTTAAITTGSSAVSIVKGSKTWGNLASKAGLTNTITPIVLRMAAGIATETPFTVQFTHADTAGHTWIEEKTFTIAGTTIIAGRVSTLTGDKPIASATVNYYGPVTGKVSTGKDGRYSVKLPDGIYTLTAVANGYQVSPAQTITIPPPPADVNFQLGRGQLVVTPTSIAVTQPEDSSATKPLTLTNSGDLPLTITVENSSLGNAISTAFYNKPSYGDVFHQAAAAVYSPLPYQEGFEGVLSLAPARYYEAWTEQDASYIYYYVIDFFVGSYSINSTTAAVGARSLYYREQLGAGFDNGMQRRFPNGTKPRYASFWMRPGTTAANNGCFSLEDGTYDASRKHWTWTPVIDVKAAAGGHFESNPANGGDNSTPFAAKQWHLVELRSIDWTSHRYDLWVNGSIVKAGIPFANPHASQITRLHLYNEIGEGEAWWDEIRLLDHDEAWLSATPVMLTLAPGASTQIDVTASARNQRPGVYKARLDMRSSDPVKPLTSVPVTMSVTTFTNTAPVAVSQSLTIQEDSRLEVTLSGMDAQQNPLTACITALPKQGTLYLPGSDHPIYAVPFDLPDAKVDYVPPQDAHGVALGSFAFVLKDYRLSSAAAAVKVTVLPADDLPRAMPDRVLGASGASFSAIKVLVNDLEPDGEKLLVTHVDPGRFGNTALNPDGSVGYVPVAGFANGTDHFDYTIADPGGGTSTARVTVGLGPLAGGADWPTAGANMKRTNFVPTQLGQRTFVEQWSVNPTGGACPLVIAEGKVFVVGWTVDHVVYAKSLDLTTGALLWQSDLSVADTFGAPSVVKGRVYLQTTSRAKTGQIYCLSADDGELLWSADAGPSQRAVGDDTPAATGGSLLVTDDLVVGEAMPDGSVFAYYIHSQLLRFRLGNAASRSPWPTTPCLTPSGLLFGGDEVTTMRVPSDGAEVWRAFRAIGSEITMPSSPIFDGQRALVQWVGGLRAIKVQPDRGTILWQQKSVWGNFLSAGNGRVYLVPPTGSRVLVLDAATGRTVGTLRTGGVDCYGGLVVMEDAIVVSDRNTPNTFVIHLSSGAVVQKLAVGGSPVVGGGFLVVASPDGVLHAYLPTGTTEVKPVARSETVATNEDVAATVTLHHDSPSPLVEEFVITRLPVRGTLYQSTTSGTRGAAISSVPAVVSDAMHRVAFLPEADAFGAGLGDFGFKASDGRNLSSEATILVNVSPVADSPRPADDLVFVQAGSFSDFQPLANDIEIDGEALTLTGFSQPSGGTVTTNANGTLRVTMSAAQAGSLETFIYEVRDPGGLTATGSVRVVVEGSSVNAWPQTGNTAAHTGSYPGSLGNAVLEERWRYNLESGGGEPVVDDGRLFVVVPDSGDSSWRVRAINLMSGGELWRSSVEWDDERVMLACFRGSLYAGSPSNLVMIDPASGSQTWKQAASYFSWPMVGPVCSDHGVFAGGLYDPELSGHDLLTGARRFGVRDEGQGLYAGALLPACSGGRLLSFRAGVFTEFDPVSGSKLGSLRLGPSNYTTNRNYTMAVTDGRAYVVNTPDLTNYELVCVDLTSRSVVWRQPGSFISPPSVANGVVYAARSGTSLSNEVRAYDAATGQPKALAYGPIAGAGRLMVTNDRLVVCSGNKVIIFDLQTAGQTGTFVGGYSSCSACVADGVLLVVFPGDSVRCFGPPIFANDVPLDTQVSATRRVANANVSSDLVIDWDLDGQPDAAEEVAGTDPHNASDVFRTCGCEALPDGQHVRISWAAKAGHSYVVECSSDLKNWSVVSAALPATGATMRFDAPVRGAHCFLRVRVVP